jgi:hypothetical protein
VADPIGSTGPDASGGPDLPDSPGDAHAGHDPEVVASLLDGDPVGADRAAAARQVAGCFACAALHRELLLLASATRELPAPVRTVDFRLTRADAERLREPLVATARLTGDMQTTASHASHDTILVATLADHSLAASEREAAEALVAACSLCAALHADLVALTAATRAMATPARPRDYSLTPADSARLRPGGWRRWIAAFGTSRDVLSRPLAVGLTTLGLAGLLVATVPAVMQGLPTAGSGASSTILSTVGAPLPQGGAELGTDMSVPAAGAPSVNGVLPDAVASPPDRSGAAVAAPSTIGGASSDPGFGAVTNGTAKGSAAESAPSDLTATPTNRVASAPSSISPMLLVSGALVILGVGLFLIRRVARRFGD